MFEPGKNSKASEFSEALILLGRDGEIRTHDPLHPMQVRYRAALHPEVSLKITALFSDRFVQFSTSR